MSDPTKSQVTQWLAEWDKGDRQALAAQLMPIVYDELRGLAGRYFRDERPDHTLQPTALVHEAYLRLVDQTHPDWQGRTHFFAVCAKVMRRVLIDYARSRKRVRRGGGQVKLELDENQAPELDSDAIIELHDAIDRLAVLDERQAQVVEMRFFGGLTMDEIAASLGVSKRTVEEDWSHAKAWLRVQFADEPKT